MIGNIGFDLKFNKLDIYAKMSHLRESGVSHFLYMTEGMSMFFKKKKTKLCFQSKSTLAFTNTKCFLLIQENIPD